MASLVKSGVLTKAWSAIIFVDMEVPVLKPSYRSIKGSMRLYDYSSMDMIFRKIFIKIQRKYENHYVKIMLTHLAKAVLFEINMQIK